MQRDNRFRYPPRRPVQPNVTDGLALAHILHGLGTVIALVFSFLAFFLVINNLYVPSTATVQGRLSLYDDTVQTLGANVWQPVVFHRQAHLSPMTWAHIPGSSNIQCIKTGAYIVHFELQSSLSSQPNASFPCKSCNAWLEARCLLQSLVIPASTAFTSPVSGTRSTSNTFMINATQGDILQIQFKSHCPVLVLSNTTQKRIDHFNDPLPSASLLIY